MKFLRTISTGRLLATLAGLVVIIAAGAAIAAGATGSGATPPAQPLASSLHQALSAKPVPGIYVDNITFTNNLISDANFAGGPKDPILQGATGRLWVAGDHQMRLELQSDNGDAEIVLNGNRFSISDPAMQTDYQGTLPASATGSKATKKDAGTHGLPTIAQLQSDINRLMGHVNLGSSAQTSNPENVAGVPAYSVSISPKHSAGMLGAVQLAWDAATGVPLDIKVLANGSSTPVLELLANDISYTKIDPSVFQLGAPAGDKVVTVATPGGAGRGVKESSKKKAPEVTGASSVAAHVPFTLAAPATVDGMGRHAVKLLDWGGKPAALVTYGENLGGIAVIEQSADSGGSHSSGSSSSGAPSLGNLSLPTVTLTDANHKAIASAQELGTALGTVLRFTHGGVAYTVVGSVSPYAAEHAAAAVLTGT